MGVELGKYCLLLVNDVVGSQLNHILTRIDLDLLGPDRNLIAEVIVFDSNQKIFI